MIHHGYKCIFIHVPRSAGSSIERWICGGDWWTVDPKSKHLLASQAKALYADYWSDYFKFAFVRNPVDRVLSCLKYKDFFGIEPDMAGNINFDNYHRIFGEEVVVEFDYRFFERKDLVRPCHDDGSVYGNILDEDIDFIGRFENLRADTELVRKTLGIRSKLREHGEKSGRAKPLRTLSEASRGHVARLYMKDCARFGYDLDPCGGARWW